jgi:hypothetical protein
MLVLCDAQELSAVGTRAKGKQKTPVIRVRQSSVTILRWQDHVDSMPPVSVRLSNMNSFRVQKMGQLLAIFSTQHTERILKNQCTSL